MVPSKLSRQTTERRPRFSMPTGMAQVTVRLPVITSGTLKLLIGHFWDISHHGCCVAFQGQHRIALPSGSRLQVRDPMSHVLHQLDVDLCWSTALSHSTFVGLRFNCALTPAETFLASYMQTSWTDLVPVSRMRWEAS